MTPTASLTSIIWGDRAGSQLRPLGHVQAGTQLHTGEVLGGGAGVPELVTKIRAKTDEPQEADMADDPGPVGGTPVFPTQG